MKKFDTFAQAPLKHLRLARHLGDDPHLERYDPDLWTDEYAFLNAPGQAQIQTELFYDYRTNVAAYPQWQAWLQQTQPMIILLFP